MVYNDNSQKQKKVKDIKISITDKVKRIVVNVYC
jgi:transcriptional regulator of met regulon